MNPAVSHLARRLLAYLEQMKDQGLRAVEVPRERAAALRRPLSSCAPKTASAGPARPAAPTSDIAGRIAVCSKCELHRSGMRVGPGKGSKAPEILFVTGAPAADASGKNAAILSPEADTVMENMLAALGLSWENAFLTCAVKCRPQENRPPEPEEAEKCREFLDEQIENLKPRVIVALGANALYALTDCDLPITQARGRWYKYGNIDLMPTYAPEYLARAPRAKWDVWKDMLLVLERLGRKPPPRPSRGRTGAPPHGQENK